jgi:hypothetical protein
MAYTLNGVYTEGFSDIATETGRCLVFVSETNQARS